MTVIYTAAACDLDAIAELDRRCFQPPWAKPVYVAELENILSTIEIGREQPEGPLAAFALWWIVCDEIHLLRMATRPEFRRRGWGRRMLQRLVAQARAHHARRVLLEVRASNDAARGLYGSVGFIVEGCRRRYYEDGEDALLMGLTLEPNASRNDPASFTV